MKFLICWLEYFGKFPRHTSFPFPFHNLHYVAWGHATDSVGGGNYIHSHHIFTTIIPFFHYHHSIFIPFTIPKNFFSNDPLMHFTSCIDIHIGMIHNRLRKGFLTLSDDFLCTLTAYLFQWIYGHNYYHNSKRKIMKWMLLTQEPTFLYSWLLHKNQP